MKKKQTKSGVTRKESLRQSKPKVVSKKANSKQARSKEKETSVSESVVIEEEDNSPSGEILSSQDSLELSASSQDSAKSTRFVYFT